MAKRRGRRRRQPVHTAKFDRCVKDVKRSGTAADPYAVCEASLGSKAQLRAHRRNRRRTPRRRPRRENPSAYKITARRAGGPELQYLGSRFATRGEPVKFPTRGLADQFAGHLKSHYGNKLRRYRLKVGPV